MKMGSADAIRVTGVLAVAAALAGCSSVTYGTGTSPGVQTMEDIAGIVDFGSKKKEPIDYSPRPPIVAPPSTEVLPPPGSSDAVAANWPKDPDALRKKMKKAQEQPRVYGEPVPSPKFTVPVAAQGSDVPPPKKLTNQQIRQMFADARGKSGSFDAAGKPVRKYLTEPPAAYREPDPNAPMEISDKPKKKSKFSLRNLWPF